MGFGYGTKLCQYRVGPEAFLRASKARLRPLTVADAAKLHACYSREVDRTHGMFNRARLAFEQMFDNRELRAIGYEADGELQGYLALTFHQLQPDNWRYNDLVIQELIYKSPATLAAIATYLTTQSDQINRVLINTHVRSTACSSTRMKEYFPLDFCFYSFIIVWFLDIEAYVMLFKVEIGASNRL